MDIGIDEFTQIGPVPEIASATVDFEHDDSLSVPGFEESEHLPEDWASCFRGSLLFLNQALTWKSSRVA